MYIITEDTPNPEVKKFIPHLEVMGNRGSKEFKNIEEAAVSQLAENIFKTELIDVVFLGSDFISLTKKNNLVWDDIRLDLIDVITDHFITHQPILKIQNDDSSIKYNVSDEDKEIVSQVIDLIDTRIRPAVAQDGGDITFDSYDNGIVYVSLKGACSGCPSSTITLKSGIENMLKHYIPEVVGVMAVGDKV